MDMSTTNIKRVANPVGGFNPIGGLNGSKKFLGLGTTGGPTKGSNKYIKTRSGLLDESADDNDDAYSVGEVRVVGTESDVDD